MELGREKKNKKNPVPKPWACGRAVPGSFSNPRFLPFFFFPPRGPGSCILSPFQSRPRPAAWRRWERGEPPPAARLPAVGQRRRQGPSTSAPKGSGLSGLGAGNKRSRRGDKPRDKISLGPCPCLPPAWRRSAAGVGGEWWGWGGTGGLLVPPCPVCWGLWGLFRVGFAASVSPGGAGAEQQMQELVPVGNGAGTRWGPSSAVGLGWLPGSGAPPTPSEQHSPYGMESGSGIRTGTGLGPGMGPGWGWEWGWIQDLDEPCPRTRLGWWLCCSASSP